MAISQNTTTLPGGGPVSSAFPMRMPPKHRDRVKAIRQTVHGVALEMILHRLQCGLCFYCNRPITQRPYRARRGTGYTRDHVVPRAAGGGNAGNIVLSCRTCNAEKGDRLPTALELAALRQLWSVVAVLDPSTAQFRRRSSELLH